MSIKWIGVIIGASLLTALVFFYNAYTESLVDKGKLITVNTQLENTVNYIDDSIKITDKYITEYVSEANIEKINQEQTRAGVIDEYLHLSKGELNNEPAIKPVETTTGISSVQNNVSYKAMDNPSDLAALRALSIRMFERYCAAGSPDKTCNSKNITDGLPSSSATN